MFPQIELVYRRVYDYTTISYGQDSDRTEKGKPQYLQYVQGSVEELIRGQEREYFATDHPKTTPHSFDHRRHRIEVTALRVGGEGGPVVPIHPIEISVNSTEMTV